MSDKQYYKKYFFLPIIKSEYLLNFIIETTYLNTNEIDIIAKLLTTENVRNLAEYMRAYDVISCETYVVTINKKITEYIKETYFKNIYNNHNICIENEDMCDSFTYDGGYFFNPVSKMAAARRVKVDVTFYDKKTHDIFKLKSGKAYSELQEIVQEVS